MSNPTDAATFGLSHAILQQLCAEFARTPAILRVLVFGSRAKGNYRPGSDIDIALMAPKLTAAQLGELENRLDDLLLPYQIDLCHFDTLQNPALIDHIQRVGQPIFPRP